MSCGACKFCFCFNLSSYFLSLLYRRCYIRFIRKVNDKKGIEGQEETRKAFDFMLNYVGMFFFYLCLVSHLFCVLVVIGLE